MATILIADDDEDARDLLARICIKAGHAVLVARDGAEALNMMHPGLDLALLDYWMPKATGAEVARALAQLGVPYIFISAVADGEVAQSIIGTNPLTYIVKPISSKLYATIDAALHKNQSERRNYDARYINQSVGILMERHHLSAAQAYVRLRDAARVLSIQVADTAARVVIAHDTLYALERTKNNN